MIRRQFIWSCLILMGWLQFATAPSVASEPAPFSEVEQREIMLAATEPLTQRDIDLFVAAVEAYEKWVRADEQRLAEFSKYSPPQKQMRVRELLGDKAGPMHDLLRHVAKIAFLREVSQPDFKASMEPRLKHMRQQIKDLEGRDLSSEPKQVLEMLKVTISVYEKAFVYPQASLDLYHKNKGLIEEMSQRLEAADKR